MTKAGKFKKMGAAMFNEASRMRLCESSGSEHYSPDDDLSDLVNSFIEREDDHTAESDIQNNNHDGEEYNYSNLQELESCFSGAEQKKKLERLIKSEDDARKKIRAETEIACGIVGERSSQGFHRRLMSHLRERGFDAGLCKTRWEKFGRYPAGEYEYVDVNVGRNRLIAEVSIAAQFEIARPTSNYSTLLDVFPRVFIGKPEEMKQVVRLMCSAIRQSMKDMNLHVPPWRKNGYMQAKWFAPYKRTTNPILNRKGPESDQSFATKRSIGFEAFPVKAYHCRDNIGAGYLTAAFSGNI